MNGGLSLRYGDGELHAELPDCRFITELAPKRLKELTNLQENIIGRLEKPVGTRPLAVMAEKASKIVVVTPDHTRALPTPDILTVVCDYLFKNGVARERVSVVVGVGNHRAVTEAEKKRIMGPLFGEIKCTHSKENGYIRKGITKRGTPVEVAVPVAEADLVIALGSIELHQLAGFSGGVKAIAAGTASRNALEHNHRLKFLQGDKTGSIEQNFVRADMEEFARIANLDFIVNAVLNEQNRVIFVTAGDPVEAHRQGAAVAQTVFTVKVPERADIVLISPGGTPRDDTVYQAQKSVKNALKAVKEDGIIVLAAKCPEGFGDPVFEQWLSEGANPEAIIDRSKKEFVLGGHKSEFIASAVQKASIFMVSEMKDREVRRMFCEPFSSLQEAVDRAFDIKGKEAQVLVMPWGGITVPV